jgi:hypothetical protein
MFCNTGDPSKSENTSDGSCKCMKQNPFQSFAPRWSESYYPERPLRGG